VSVSAQSQLKKKTTCAASESRRTKGDSNVNAAESLVVELFNCQLTRRKRSLFLLSVSLRAPKQKSKKLLLANSLRDSKERETILSRCVGILTAERKRSRSVSKPDLHNEISTCKTALAFYRVPRSREFEEKTHYFTIISEIHLPTMLTNKIVFISPGAVSPGEEELKGNWRAE
jgi:hypothetical protein